MRKSVILTSLVLILILIATGLLVLAPGPGFTLGGEGIVVPDRLSELEPDNPFSDGEIRYLYEDFSGFDEYSRSIDSFEHDVALKINGRPVETKQSWDNYGGEWSIQFEVAPEDAPDQELHLQRDIPSVNLSRWNEEGVFSAWIRLENPSSVDAISLKLVDQEGNFRVFRKLENYNGPEENEIKQDDPHHDYLLPENIYSPKWEDYVISEGWNFLFWPSNEFSESAGFDIGKVSAYEIIIETNSEFERQTVRFDNLRVSDGLQKEKNPTNGAWFAPNGMPQYGVWDIDDNKIRLMTVRQTQYPSNGDHTRLISRKNVPENFKLRMQFKLVNLAEKNWFQKHTFLRNYYHDRDNSWIRIAYDFEHKFDAGHDWFGLFMSLEYEKFGLITVIPKERYFLQEQEPTGNSFTPINRRDFRPKEDTLYQIELTVQGQHNIASWYEVSSSGVLKELETVEYTFERNRLDERFPLSIEATGNTQLEIYLIEVLALDGTSEPAKRLLGN